MTPVKDLLLEIGTEEIPARFLPEAIGQMRQLAGEVLSAQRLPYDKLMVFATPRRLALFVHGLAAAQENSVAESKGPALAAAYDENGQPTRALLGFCKGQGIDSSQVEKKAVGGSVYVFARKEITGRPAVEVLPEVLPLIISKLSFPKPMRWAYEEMRFVRPIRWLTALFGSEIIPVEIAGIKSGRTSRGHRFFYPSYFPGLPYGSELKGSPGEDFPGGAEFEIRDAAEYVQTLRKYGVIVDQDERLKMIREKISQLLYNESCRLPAPERGRKLVWDEDEKLLQEVTFLVECPAALAGSFDAKYLDLPRELVITPMKEHQRYFPVYDENGALLNKFITVYDGGREDVVRAGNEKVLRARLADAEFFWYEDGKKPLESNLARLSAIVFHEKLGTLQEKVQRIRKLSAFLGQTLACDEPRLAAIDRAALLCKCDLVSRSVCEFTELQGIMGEYYARRDGETAEVAAALREHYLPRFAGDRPPQSEIGAILAIADKMDSVAGFFAAGMQP
ncbi:MAG: glycine--tRNA ligase subunit beta, partial [Clostridiales bacterium]|nr:glycine--tRNA ligase subunit beta [Clostridiales bacterium]